MLYYNVLHLVIVHLFLVRTVVFIYLCLYEQGRYGTIAATTAGRFP